MSTWPSGKQERCLRCIHKIIIIKCLENIVFLFSKHQMVVVRKKDEINQTKKVDFNDSNAVMAVTIVSSE